LLRRRKRFSWRHRCDRAIIVGTGSLRLARRIRIGFFVALSLRNRGKRGCCNAPSNFYRSGVCNSWKLRKRAVLLIKVILLAFFRIVRAAVRGAGGVSIAVAIR
jgi:hypothetical protein